MKRWIVLCAAAMMLEGCSLAGKRSLYEVHLTGGEQLYTDKNPVLKDDFYEFYDVNDQKYIISRSLVLYIEPTEFAY